MARWAALIQERRSEKPVMLVDAGDFCAERRIRHQEVKERYFFEGMKRLGYDCIGLGENELRFGRKRLLETMKNADLPLVSSNIIDKRGNGHLVPPYRIVTVGGRKILFWRSGGIKVGVFSVVLPVYVHSIDEQISRYYDVQNSRMSALEMVSALRQKGCDLVVALSHLGWENSYNLAGEVPGIDIVINGHRKHHGTHHEFAGGTVVIDTGINRTSFTEIDVVIENGKPRFVVKEMGREVLAYEGDPGFLALEKSYEEELEAIKKGNTGGNR
jgi:2',3'-cyclic-nucleotide 2'-phosphodiesterase (5'-nucleotidase family)